CCGMSGTYGHAPTNHQTSLGIYEFSSHPAMQPLPRNRSLATGSSSRRPVHRVDCPGLLHPVPALLELIK
ncbi:hypothetical protein, partial [Escherichia coli]|uniref:hypothetical protein n=1 Tax=Escherichia coli TaxID=562 RepID=UPI00098AD5D6